MAAKAVPPVTVVGATLVGLPLDDWIKYATLIYVVVMAGHQLWKWHREWKTARKEDDKSA